MTVKKLYQGKSAVPSKYATGSGPGRPAGLGPYASNETMTRDSGKVDKTGNPREPKRDESKRISFGGGSMSRPVGGKKIKRY
jgi:hypothetical protein